MLQTVLKQESSDHRSAELKFYADQLEQSAPLGPIWESLSNENGLFEWDVLVI